MNNEVSVVIVIFKIWKFEKRSQYTSESSSIKCVFLLENMRIAGKYEYHRLQVKKESMFYLWWHNLLCISEIRSKEYFRWIHCFKLVNKAKRSRMKVSKRRLRVKDSLSIIIQHVSGDHYISLISLCQRYSSSFIPVYEFLIKCELIVTSLHTRCCRQKANRC